MILMDVHTGRQFRIAMGFGIGLKGDWIVIKGDDE